ncbi:MAG: PAS domain-containing protein [Holophagaceae bacterium]|uniref:histidine kinase n=1 Tax=Candidatus Geothrix skivensis TaxID=2954439 RepID=A0A9D7SJ47_9BACT|nr:PAS domain-containing protein [Candidatus Geothrix skivensis]
MSEPDKLHPKASLATTGALRVALLYAGFSGLWILLSDRAVEALVQDATLMTRVSIAKGWAFVAVTATLLFIMVKRLVHGVADREAKLQTLIRAIPDLVWLKDPEGVYRSCNGAFERVYGAREAEIVGKTDYDFVPKEVADLFRENDREAVASGGTRQQEEWFSPAGTQQPRCFETLKTPIYDQEGELIGVLGIGRDVTEQRQFLAERSRLEAQLHQAQKMELVGRFAGGVAHDYNNMLGVILGNADITLSRMPPEHPDRRNLEEIARAARHSAELTGQLLAFARQQPMNPQVVDLNAAIDGLQGVLGRLIRPEIRLSWTPGSGLWRIRVDPTQLGQVLTNLVVNARDAIASRGSIEVTTSNRTLTQTDCATMVEAEPGDHVCLSVSDDGCGMSPDLVTRIFEPFFTTKPEGRGTGLGLAMVHGVVKQNHGTMQVESGPGKGTCFQIFFPRA